MSFFEILRKIPIVDFIAVRIRWAMAADEKRPTMFRYELAMPIWHIAISK